MAEIYGTTTLENKLRIQSVGDVVTTVRGRRCVVSANGFENKMTGHDVRLWAKAIDERNSDPQPNVPRADERTEDWINSVNWPDWPDAETVLPHW